MIEHLLWSTATALIGLAFAWLLRNRSAAIRFNILFIASLRFAIPTPWLTSAGSSLVKRMPAPVVATVQHAAVAIAAYPPFQTASPMPARIGSTSQISTQIATASRPDTVQPIPILPIAWALGTLLVLIRVVRCLHVEIPEVRTSSELELAALQRVSERLGMRSTPTLRIVAQQLVPGALGIWRPTVVLPDRLSEQLTDAELRSVLAHEVAHVLRRDNLTATIARTIIAVFWFHPLVHLLMRSMLIEREMACDELVLTQSTEREHYLSGIAKVCQQSLAQSHSYAGITGSNLKQRLEHIQSMSTSGAVRPHMRFIPVVLAAFGLFIPVTTAFLQAQPNGATATKNTNRRVRTAPDTPEGRVRLEIDTSTESGKFMARLGPVPRQGRSAEVMALLPSVIPMLEQEIKADPTRTDLRLTLASMYRVPNRVDESIKLNEALLADIPDKMIVYSSLGHPITRASIYYDLALASQAKGDWRNVRKYLKLNVQASGQAKTEVDNLLRRFLAIRYVRFEDRNLPVPYIDRIAPIDINLAVALNTTSLFSPPSDYVRTKH
ncbi:MAG: M56 family metallopeptidase [Acidobacteriota bacterium]